MTTPVNPRRRSSSRSGRFAFLVAAAITFGAPALVFGHAVVYPRASTPAARERYVLRVPNERDVATSRIEIRFPANVRVTSFIEVPGWSLTTLTDSAGAITGAVWTGTLEPARTVELPFLAVNPDEETALVWPTFQTYADGEVVEWVGPEGSDRPASVTPLAAVDSVATSGSPAQSSTTLYIAVGALVISMISLGLALRR